MEIYKSNNKTINNTLNQRSDLALKLTIYEMVIFKPLIIYILQ